MSASDSSPDHASPATSARDATSAVSDPAGGILPPPAAFPDVAGREGGGTLDDSDIAPARAPMGDASPSARLLCVPPHRPRGALPDFAAQAIVDARSGAVHRLDALWRESPVVILFLRRLGCALCRVTALEFSDARGKIEGAGAALVALSFEAFGTGSDADSSFERGAYFPGPVFTISKEVYESLFGRKGLFSGMYGLADVSRTKLAECTERRVSGNLRGDGMLLGGQFVVEKGGRVLREKRQAFFGDDLSVEDVTTVLRESSPRPRPSLASGSTLGTSAGSGAGGAGADAETRGAAAPGGGAPDGCTVS